MKFQNEHIFELASDLLADIELTRLPAESLLLKATRLARFVDNSEIKLWLSCELKGYNSVGEEVYPLMYQMGRFTDYEKKLGYWQPLAEIDAKVQAENAKLNCLRTPDISGDYAVIAVNNANAAISATATTIAKFTGIKSRAIAKLHGFVAETYYQLSFDYVAETIFSKSSVNISDLIGSESGELAEMVTSVVERLHVADDEAISHALLTCRRMISLLGDEIMEFNDSEIEVNGETLDVSSGKTKNRILAFLGLKCESKSRRKRLKANLLNLWDRVSTGVHSEVNTEEAEYLFLNTYILLGELLSIKRMVEPVLFGTVPIEASPEIQEG